MIPGAEGASVHTCVCASASYTAFPTNQKFGRRFCRVRERERETCFCVCPAIPFSILFFFPACDFLFLVCVCVCVFVCLYVRVTPFLLAGTRLELRDRGSRSSQIIYWILRKREKWPRIACRAREESDRNGRG